MTIYKKLNQARTKFHSLEMKKSGRNEFAKYNYFELGDFLKPILTILDELGLCGVVSFDKEIATLKIVDVETGENFTITSPMGSASLKGCHEVQNIGAVETYQRRYLWMAAFEIIEQDAVDASEGVAPPKPATPAIARTPLPANQVADLSLAISESATAEDLEKNFKSAYRVAMAQEDASAGNKFVTLKNARKTALGIK